MLSQIKQSMQMKKIVLLGVFLSLASCSTSQTPSSQDASARRNSSRSIQSEGQSVSRSNSKNNPKEDSRKSKPAQSRTSTNRTVK